LTDINIWGGHKRSHSAGISWCGIVSKALLQAAKENAKQPMRAVILDGDMFHDNQEDPTRRRLPSISCGAQAREYSSSNKATTPTLSAACNTWHGSPAPPTSGS
jgi:hypothetical protein